MDARMITAADVRMFEAAKRREPVVVTVDGKARLGRLICWHTKSRQKARVEWPTGNKATVRCDAVALLYAGPLTPRAAA